jgi:hypothetical protein
LARQRKKVRNVTQNGFKFNTIFRINFHPAKQHIHIKIMHAHKFDTKSLFLIPGRGDEVRARVDKFQKNSQLKGLITIGSFIALGFYLKITNPYVPH